jgi:uncharacterized Ntn-hydrolase superfamily protein
VLNNAREYVCVTVSIGALIFCLAATYHSPMDQGEAAMAVVIMVDPLGDGNIPVADIMVKLKEAALRDRERIYDAEQRGYERGL